jgi:chromate transporter
VDPDGAAAGPESCPGRNGAGGAGTAAPVPFREALRFWVKLGFISFGGPAGQIAIMHRELVARRRWISEERFLHALNVCMLLPGPEAQQLATYIGWLLHGVRGGLASGVLFVLPSAVLLFGLSCAYVAWGAVPAGSGLLRGFKAVVVAIVAEAVWRMGRRTLRAPMQVIVVAGAFTAIHFTAAPFPAIVLAAAIAGLLAARLWPAGCGPAAAPPGEAVRARTGVGATAPSRTRSLRTLAAGAALLAAPWLLLVVFLGAKSLPVRQYSFFTGAALVTFGGAYAVLAYVTQAAVQTYGWISSRQAMDGLALAETTPGPLIMVLPFIGFVTGWNHPGDLTRPGAATLGAVVTIWVTFVPSITLVLASAPWIEELRRSRAMRAALSGVTSAAIGVVLHLALVFGQAVVLPEGIAGGIDGFSAVIVMAGVIALHRYQAGAAWVVAAGGLAGLAAALIF